MMLWFNFQLTTVQKLNILIKYPCFGTAQSHKPAPLVELADTLDLGSSGRPWGFKSLKAHHSYP